MSLLSLTIRHLLACGASAEAVAKFVEEAEAAIVAEQSAAIAVAREYERERKRTYRMSRGQRACPGDNGDTPSPSSFSPTPPHITTPPPDLANAKSVKSAKSALAECLFLEFWEVYPRRVGRGAARKAFTNALKRAKPEEIMAGARRYAASCPDPQFTKHPSTWLNADCWLDEPTKLTKTNVVGFRKEFPPAYDPPKPPQEVRDAQVARFLKVRKP